MTTPSENNAESVATALQNIELDLKKAELQKLLQEIENAKPKRRRRIDSVVPFIPLLTAALSIAGFLWGVWMFLAQQEKDRVTRHEERISRDRAQFRANYEQLLQFTSNPNISVPRALFLRDDIAQLIKSAFEEKEQEAEEKKLKENIFNLISTDCDFTQPKHVRLDIAAMKRWDHYAAELKKVPSKRYLNKYIGAITYLHTRDSHYIETAEYNAQTGFIEAQAPKEPLAVVFASLIEGFACHLELLELDEPDRQKQIDAFQFATKNELLTADLFRSQTSPVPSCKAGH